MYIIQIESVYSQGVGHFELFTDNIKFINKFRNEIVRYKNDLEKMYPEDEDEIELWDFYEDNYKITDYKPNKKKFKCYCIHKNVYPGNFDKLDNIEKILSQEKYSEINSHIMEYDNTILPDYVYNYIDINKKPIHINKFDILGKNYKKK